MSPTAELLLGVIAVAVAVMAIVQVGAIIAGLRVARRVQKLTSDLETDVKPLLANLTSISSDASRAANLAAAQIERFDKTFAHLTSRIDHTLTTAQQIVNGPAREGMAIVAGIRAAMTALQGMREANRRRTPTRAPSFEEEEESLFIG